MKIKEAITIGALGLSVLTSGCFGPDEGIRNELTQAVQMEQNQIPLITDRQSAEELELWTTVRVTSEDVKILLKGYSSNDKAHVTLEDGAMVFVDIETILTQDDQRRYESSTTPITFEGLLKSKDTTIRIVEAVIIE